MPRTTQNNKNTRKFGGFVWRQVGDKIDTQISWHWKHFFASKIVFRVIVCWLRGVGSMSSSRRINPFIVLFSSGHRRLFLVASLWAYIVVASFLCLRVVGSSFRRLRYMRGHKLVGQVLDVWGHILYCYCYPVTLLPCYSVSLFPWDRANILYSRSGKAES